MDKEAAKLFCMTMQNHVLLTNEIIFALNWKLLLYAAYSANIYSFNYYLFEEIHLTDAHFSTIERNSKKYR
jgi:hypothetical protein